MGDAWCHSLNRIGTKNWVLKTTIFCTHNGTANDLYKHVINM